MVPVIDVYGGIARKRYEGELSFSWDEGDGLVQIPFVRFETPAHFSLRYTIGEDDAVDVEGKVSFTLGGLCSRCLGEAHAQVEEEVYARFLPEGAAAKDEEYFYRNGSVDLREFLRDSVLIALPNVLHCESCAKDE